LHIDFKCFCDDAAAGTVNRLPADIHKLIRRVEVTARDNRQRARARADLRAQKDVGEGAQGGVKYSRAIFLERGARVLCCATQHTGFLLAQLRVDSLVSGVGRGVRGTFAARFVFVFGSLVHAGFLKANKK